ncbi:MAG: DUF3899 domain-containing protein [Acetatifactor sp.]
MKDKKKRIRNFALTALTACLITVLVVIYESNSGKNMLYAFCDGFFVASICMLCLGIMVWAAGLGSFYGIHYLFYSAVSLFTLRKSRFEERKNYYDFLMEKEGREKSNPRALFLVGGIWFLLSLIFLFLFEQSR